MLDICVLEKVIADEENYTLHITVKKSMVYPFMKVFDGLQGVSNQLAYKIRISESQTAAALEKAARERDEKFDAIKAQIRAQYRTHFEELQDERQALKATRKSFLDYWWLVREVRKEVWLEKELKVVRLKNKGLTSKEIGKALNLHPGSIRKILARYKP